jgi:hypothetical protein
MQAFFGTLVIGLVLGLLVAFFALVGSFLGLCAGYLLCTYMLNSLKRCKEQTHVQQSDTSLLEVVLVLPLEWTHPENMTPQFSLGEQNVHWNRSGIVTWAVAEAWHLHNVDIELLHTMHKLMHADTLGLLEHVHDVILLLLSRVDGKHGENVEHHAIFK